MDFIPTLYDGDDKEHSILWRQIMKEQLATLETAGVSLDEYDRLELLGWSLKEATRQLSEI